MAKATLNLALCPHPKSQATILATLRGYTKVLCLNCGLEYWRQDE